MHYYQHHIGDYRAATNHLTDEEDLTYRRLIELYYDTEQPISIDIAKVSRRVRMHADVVTCVLAEFFVLSDDGYRHARCDAEIEQYRSKSEQASRAGKASAQRRSNVGLTDVEHPLDARSTDVQPTMNHEPRTKNQLNIPSVCVNAEAVDPPRLPAAPHEKILALYHRQCPTLQRVMMLNDTRRKHLTSRWREVMVTDGLTEQAAGLEIFDQFFQRVSQSKFLTGQTQRNVHGRQWKATFDWLILPTNFLKVCEGQYDNGKG